MRTQEFRFQTSPFSRSTRFPFTSTASPPAPLAIRKTPSGRRRKSRRQSHKFFKHLLRLPGGAAKRWSGQALPTRGRSPKNRVVGFLGEDSENFSSDARGPVSRG